VVGHREYAKHEITPIRVWFHPRHVREAFVEEIDEEDSGFLLIALTINGVNKNFKR